MEYRILGKTGLKISRLGFGGIPIQRIDAEGTKSLMAQLMAEGVNYIDTARAYTVSEEYLGYALKGIRQNFVLATKSMARTAEAMAQDIDLSLAKLQTDYIDLYQIHNPNAKDFEAVQAPGGALEALQAARKAGKIGHIGITLHAVELFEKAVELPWVETIMFPYNIVETQGEALIKKAAEKNIGFVDMKPLAGGAIEDASLAMRFLVSNPDVTVVIPGMADAKEVEVNLTAAADLSPLTAEEQEKGTPIASAAARAASAFSALCSPSTARRTRPRAFPANIKVKAGAPPSKERSTARASAAAEKPKRSTRAAGGARIPSAPSAGKMTVPARAAKREKERATEAGVLK